MTSMAEVMDYLVDSQVENLKPSVMADLFHRMIWIVADNGGEIERVRETWLKGGDFKRVQIALFMQETFPFVVREEMEGVLSLIAKKWPSLSERCQDLSKRRPR
jgi:hypothetical protein